MAGFTSNIWHYRWWIACAAAIGAIIFFVPSLIFGPRVEVVSPVRGPAVQAVYATGTVESSIMLPIATRGSARLAELLVDEGASVKAGQVLARLESEDLKGAVASFEATEKYAQKEFERTATLRAKGAVSQQTYDKAKSDWESAQGALAQARAQAGFMDLTAPSEGVVIKRDGEIGQLIPAGQAVFWLSVNSPLRVSAEVDEEDIPLVTPGQSVAIRADAFPGKIFQGKVHHVTPMGDRIARSYRVRIELDGQTPLNIGMTVETNIIVSERKDALLIPTSCIENEKVWVVRDSRIRLQPVTLGARGPTRSEVIEGIQASDLIVMTLRHGLDEGSAVRTILIEPQQ